MAKIKSSMFQRNQKQDAPVAKQYNKEEYECLLKIISNPSSTKAERSSANLRLATINQK